MGKPQDHGSLHDDRELYGEERCRWFAGEHRLNDEIVKKVLLPLVKELVGEKQY